jgi:hypothetical protein
MITHAAPCTATATTAATSHHQPPPATAAAAAAAPPQVFSRFTALYARGLTPNPDLACNRFIKFDALLDWARAQGADAVATGHYARLSPAPDDSGRVQLLRGARRRAQLAPGWL